MTRCLYFFFRAVLWILGLVVVLLFLRALGARKRPDLEIWHTATLESEFRAEDHSGITFPDYLDLENALFKELSENVHAHITPSDRLANSRYNPESTSFPDGLPQNWNRTYELVPEEIRGGVLLLHGLTDSPYSLRRIGRLLHEQGYYVLAIRLPGHGTIPAALKSVSRDDWSAAVRVGARHAGEQTGPDSPFLIAGYSNGGALAVEYVLDALEDPSLRQADQLILFSPALGITRLAVTANAHRLFSWLPFFEKSAWSSIMPEFDPFKYNSFPMSTGFQTHLLTRSLHRRIDREKRKGTNRALPPILTFKSLADSTVRIEDLVENLYNKLADTGNELVVFDVNRKAQMKTFFRSNPGEHLAYLLDKEDLPYRLTLITNTDAQSDTVIVRSKEAGTGTFTSTSLSAAWPQGVYSLSHIALPFSPDDPVYGFLPNEHSDYGLNLGRLEPRGERAILNVPADFFTRLRCNPFIDYVDERIRETGLRMVRQRNALTVAPGRTEKVRDR